MPVKIRSINPFCSVLLFISSCDHKRFSKGREHAIWRRVFSCSGDAHRTDKRDQRCRSSRCTPIHCHSHFCTVQPAGSPHCAQSPKHWAERHSLLPMFLTQSLTSLFSKAPLLHYFTASLLERLVSQRSETYCRITFSSFYFISFFNCWHLYLMDACKIFLCGSGNKGLREGMKENNLFDSDVD